MDIDPAPDLLLGFSLVFLPGAVLARDHVDLLNRFDEFSVLFSRASDHHPRPI
jgi:hypothetical protein